MATSAKQEVNTNTFYPIRRHLVRVLLLRGVREQSLIKIKVIIYLEVKDLNSMRAAYRQQIPNSRVFEKCRNFKSLIEPKG